MQLSRMMLFAAALVLGANEVRPGQVDVVPPAAAEPAVEPSPGTLRVMTYNVKGLPWPAASGRSQPLREIGLRLRALREAGRQPHIVILQEAFTDEAKAIGRLGGYRYFAYGPRAGSLLAPQAVALTPGHVAAARALKGEGLGQWLDGGLAIFSDYPIDSSAAWVFPAGACAGFDCLAAKGVLVAKVRMPGTAEPITVVNTHLNSDVSSTGVGAARSDASFTWQYAALQRLVASLPTGTPVIFAGDVNIGPTPGRRCQAARLGAPLAGAEEALPQALAARLVPQGDLAAVQRIHARRIDQVFYRSTQATGLSLVRLQVPFTTGEPDSLSDHAAFVTTYRLFRPAARQRRS